MPKTRKPDMPRRIGRPSIFSEDIAAAICARIAEGASLRTVCEADDMPDRSTVFLWLRNNPEFRALYETASTERASSLAEEALEIADRLSRRNSQPTSEEVQAARLQVDTRKWFAAKLAPKQYGDRMKTETTVMHKSPYAGMTEEQILQELASMGFVLSEDGKASGQTAHIASVARR